jgi:uncharacterized damage-inducible protein DinB
MAQLIVEQLRFTRRELMRCIEGVSEEDASQRLMPMNCISWIVGHLANQEHRYWVSLAQGKNVAPRLRELVGYGQPASTPSLLEMKATWQAVTAAADVYLETLTPAVMETCFIHNGSPVDENVGTLLMRNVYHYWYHMGEVASIRQLLGHKNLPEFVGDMSTAAYHAEV